jgi:hypothetical protein
MENLSEMLGEVVGDIPPATYRLSSSKGKKKVFTATSNLSEFLSINKWTVDEKSWEDGKYFLLFSFFL